MAATSQLFFSYPSNGKDHICVIFFYLKFAKFRNTLNKICFDLYEPMLSDALFLIFIVSQERTRVAEGGTYMVLAFG